MKSLALALAVVLGVPGAARASGSTTFVPTYTKAYQAAEYTDLGLAPGSMPLQLAIGLVPRNAAQIPVLLREMATPGTALSGVSLSAAQTTAMFGQTSANVRAVEAYLVAQGFKNVAVSPDALLVNATGTVALADAAFATKVDAVKIAGVVTYANVLAAQVPSSLGGIVAAVEGLSGTTMDAGVRAPLTPASCTAVPALGRCVAGALDGNGLRAFYDTANVASASKTALAIFTAGSVTQFVSDFRAGAAAAEIAPGRLSIVPTGAASTNASLLANADLAAQAALAISGGVSNFVVYVAHGLGEADLTGSLERFESGDSEQAASVPFGICEDVAATDGSLFVDDTLLGLAALHGQTVFAATGDRLGGCTAHRYPASSPYAVAVGGTTVLGASAGLPQSGEVAWTATDGGPSAFEAAPFWQSGIVPAAATAANLRAVPDLALDGDPNTGLFAIVNGARTQLGGSTLAAALALGIWGRLESAHGNALGFASPRFYHEFADLRTPANAQPPANQIEQPIGGFRDLLIGTNGLPAGPEYDFATGLGSLDARLQALDITR